VTEDYSKRQISQWSSLPLRSFFHGAVSMKNGDFSPAGFQKFILESLFIPGVQGNRNLHRRCFEKNFVRPNSAKRFSIANDLYPM